MENKINLILPSNYTDTYFVDGTFLFNLQSQGNGHQDCYMRLRELITSARHLQARFVPTIFDVLGHTWKQN